MLIIEADEEVGGEIVTFYKGEGLTADGQIESVWVPHPNAYERKPSAHPAILLSHEVHILIFSLLHDLLPGKIDLVISGSASQKIMKWFFAAFEEKMGFAIEGDGGVVSSVTQISHMSNGTLPELQLGRAMTKVALSRYKEAKEAKKGERGGKKRKR